jgi:hypothetical protein
MGGGWTGSGLFSLSGFSISGVDSSNYSSETNLKMFASWVDRLL